jgi:hypothetical protein
MAKDIQVKTNRNCCCQCCQYRPEFGIYEENSLLVNGYVAFRHKDNDKICLWWADGWRIGLKKYLGTTTCYMYRSEGQISNTFPFGIFVWQFWTGYRWTRICLDIIEISRPVDPSVECIQLKKKIKDLQLEVLKVIIYVCREYDKVQIASEHMIAFLLGRERIWKCTAMGKDCNRERPGALHPQVVCTGHISNKPPSSFLS